MPRLVPVPARRLDCIFEKAGFKYDRMKGDHRIYVRRGTLRPVVIPQWDAVPLFIIKNNLRSAQMSREEYFRLLAACP